MFKMKVKLILYELFSSSLFLILDGFYGLYMKSSILFNSTELFEHFDSYKGFMVQVKHCQTSNEIFILISRSLIKVQSCYRNTFLSPQRISTSKLFSI